jgi:hypothetical protein
MLSKRSFSCRPLVVCILTLGLSGCVAAPLVQIAASHMAASDPPCMTGPGCHTDVAANSFGDMSKGVTASFHKLIGSSSDAQAAVTDPPIR